MITLDWLYARCRQEGDCLVWTGYLDAFGVPQTRIDGRARPVRRLVWQAARGNLLRGLWVCCTCETKGCVNPDHLEQTHRSTRMRGRFMPVTQRANIALARRAVSRISEDAIREMRESDCELKPLAEKYGVDLTYVSAVRLGKIRRDLTNPFAGLMP